MHEKVSDGEKKDESKSDDTSQMMLSEPTDREVKEELSEVDKDVSSMPQSKKRKLHLPVSHKKRWLLLIFSLVIVLVILGVIPYTRYKILGLFVKEKYSITVTDSITKTPISGAKVHVGSSSSTTDANGKAVVTVPVGDETVTVSKQYYKTVTKQYRWHSPLLRIHSILLWLRRDARCQC